MADRVSFFVIVTPKLWALPLELQWSGWILYVQFFCFQLGIEKRRRW